MRPSSPPAAASLATLSSRTCGTPTRTLSRRRVPAAATLGSGGWRRGRALLFATLTFTLTLSLFAQSPTRLSNESPILNWRLPLFTADGSRREAVVRGSEARVLPDRTVELKDLLVHLFSRDDANRIETILASPTARVLADQRMVVGDGVIRVINDQFEATGTGWRYDHEGKKVSLQRNVRVSFRAQIDDLLK